MTTPLITHLEEADQGLRAHPPQPDAQGWRDIATAPRDGSDILILASGMAIEARYAPGSWGPDIPGEVQEYDGPVWVAFDDLTQFEIEEGVFEGGLDHHGSVTHWMPLPPPPSAHPAPIKPSGDTGELRERVARIIEGACSEHHHGYYGKVSTRPQRRADAVTNGAARILDLIQSERAG